MADVEELEQKLNQLTDVVIAIAQKQDATAEVVANLSRTQARAAENNARAFAEIQQTFRDVLELTRINAEAIAETRAIADSNARAIQALADD